MKKRVALITHETSPVGGLPTMVAFLRRVLEQCGRFEVGVLSLATSANDAASLQLRSPKSWVQGARVERNQQNGNSSIHAGVWGSELEFQRYRPSRELTALLNQYDLLQFVVGSPPWVCVARDVRRPIFVWTATTTRADRESQMSNGSATRRMWSSLMVPITERYERRALQKADAVFALSEYTSHAVAPIVGKERVLLAPCGVDTDLFRPTSDVRDNYILCVARLSDPRKNVGLLLEAYASLRKKVLSVPDLYLVGDPPSKASQAKLQTLGLANSVRMLGPKQGEELAEIYRRARFFVLSSNEEGLGIVILEAMASGLPVVSTACGGPATAVKDGETGFLTPVGDVVALAAALEKLTVDASLRERMGRAGRSVATERFSLTETGKVFLDTYRLFLECGDLSPLLGVEGHKAVSGGDAAA